MILATVIPNHTKGSKHPMQGSEIDSMFYKPIISISIPPAQREAFYQALLALREREQRPFVSLSALVVKAVIAAANGTALNENAGNNIEHAALPENAAYENGAF
jgi:hypothetical protein